jgi:hypothetical protein
VKRQTNAFYGNQKGSFEQFAEAFESKVPRLGSMNGTWKNEWTVGSANAKLLSRKLSATNGWLRSALQIHRRNRENDRIREMRISCITAMLTKSVVSFTIVPRIEHLSLLHLLNRSYVCDLVLNRDQKICVFCETRVSRSLTRTFAQSSWYRCSFYFTLISTNL